VAIQDLSTNAQQALEFAESEFANGTRFWPRLLIRCLEDAKEGKAFEVVHGFYTRRCGDEPDATIKSWILDLGGTSDADQLRKRASEIWDDPRCRSLTCRGLTRLFGAKACYLECNFHEYEIELTRATGMLTSSGDKLRDDEEFALIMQIIRGELEK
jgi:hypothetical protein